VEIGLTKDHPRARALMLAAAAILLLAGVVELVLARWLIAAFDLCVGLFFWKGRAIERWPRVARILFIICLAALGVAMVVKLTLDMKGSG
jgi:hypothetical protein